ncbi:MAG: ABC transporter ATP-binding protein [Clostridia bacterium]|nr:ABC transporter ATP-binding protein [Clostridia bacterium]
MRGRRARLMARLIGQNGALFLGASVCTLLSVGADFLTPLLLAETIDHYLMGKPSTLPAFVNSIVDGWGGAEFMASHLWVAGLALVGVQLLGGLFGYLKGRWQSMAGENAARALREKLYSHIQRLPFSYHAKAETGDLVQRCTSDVDTVRRFLSSELLSVVSALCTLTVAFSVLWSTSVRLTLITMITVPALFLFAFLFFRWVAKAFSAADEAEGAMSAVLQENLTGVRVVRAFGQQQREVERFDKVNRDYSRKNFRLTRLLCVYWSSSDALCMTQSCLTLMFCVAATARGEITVGTLVVFTSYVARLLWPIRQMGRILSDLGKSFVALERMDAILRQPAEPEEPEAVTPPLDGDIVFDHVSFSYDGKRDVLNDLCCTIPAGKTTAILGSTGSGKSSAMHLLQRLFTPQKGSITIGGVDIATIDRAYLRRHVGLVLQEPFLYSKTLRENVGIAVPGAPEGDVLRAARDAQAEGFILGSEKGWDTVVGERGVTLSGGQKQRVAIARTLVKDSDILIFDDSLSAVDTETDAAIRKALRERSQDTTTIIISHRVSTLSQADLILVMENGRVTQQGTHKELISQPGLYRRIFDIQTALEDEFRRGGKEGA